MNLVCRQLHWTVSLFPREQLPSPASVYPPQAMFLPRFQWDPWPASHHVQEALLLMDLWVFLLSKFVYWQLPWSKCNIFVSVRFSSCFALCLPVRFFCCLVPCHCFTQNIIDTPVSCKTSLTGLTVLQRERWILLSCAVICRDWNLLFALCSGSAKCKTK